MTASTVFDELRDALLKLEFEGAAVGIDLGTTKSCIAVARFEDGEILCECEPVDEPGQPEGQIAVPSVVAVRDGVAIVGHAAKRLARTPRFLQQKGSFSETKNEIGLRHTYSRAPSGFRSATDIAAHLIAHLVSSTGIDDGLPDAPVVITVPASFHGAQRSATLEAAETALDGCQNVRLLDEPYAAVLDLLHRDPGLAGEHLVAGATWLVFDFGGGTCDVALFTLQASASAALSPRLLATRRVGQQLGLEHADVDALCVMALLRFDEALQQTLPDSNTRFDPVIAKLLPTLLKIKPRELQRRIGPNSALHRMRLVRSARFQVSDLEAPPLRPLLEALTNIENIDRDPLSYFLAPAMPSQLTVDDYSHLPVGIELLADVLRNAYATRRTGVNLLLHGAPGTGKTQLSRLLAQEVNAAAFEVPLVDEDGDARNGNLFDQLDAAALRRFDIKVKLSYLRTDQRIALFDDCIVRYGIAAPAQQQEQATKRLSRLDRLTPGDFQTVLRRRRLVGAGDALSFVEALAAEQAGKRDGESRTIGFV